MFALNVKSNTKAFTRHLTNVQKKQVPFALARALTWTAQDCQAAIQSQIPKVFNTTKKWWLKQQPTGIKVKPAKKDRLATSVFTNAHFARLQEEGGLKIPHVGKGLLVPSVNVPKYGRKAGGARKVIAGRRVLRKGGKPGGSFVFTMASGKGGVFRRKGKKKNPIQLLYTYVPTATITGRWAPLWISRG